MDRALECWYFSTMARTAARPETDVVPFHGTKYGRELLIDAAFVRSMPTFLRHGRPHALAFHDILLVTRGRGLFLLDADQHRVRPGALFFTRPGQLREWRSRGLDGACLFFTDGFLADTFSDARFLDQFAYFSASRPSCAILLRPQERRRFLNRFAAMEAEIRDMKGDAPDALRALLYEILILLNRFYLERYPEPGGVSQNAIVERFRKLVEREFRHRHRVAWYARELGVSPGHLGALCRATLRQGTSRLIRGRIALEAKRLLLYGDLTAAQVADRLGFDDPAYFARFFKREAGDAPTRFRASRRRALIRGPAKRYGSGRPDLDRAPP